MGSSQISRTLLTPSSWPIHAPSLVVAHHFPGFTIGLARWLATMQGMRLATDDPVCRRLFDFWIKIFAASFGMGVVSGIVMAFQFGTNWSVLAEKTGPIHRSLLGYETFTVFLLEATFLGVMLVARPGVGRMRRRTSDPDLIMLTPKQRLYLSSGGPATQARRSYSDFCGSRDCRRRGTKRAGQRVGSLATGQNDRHRATQTNDRIGCEGRANKAPVQAKDPK
jgi:hypothetical protein